MMYSMKGAQCDIVMQSLFRVRNLTDQRIELLITSQTPTDIRKIRTAKQLMYSEGDETKIYTTLQTVQSAEYQLKKYIDHRSSILQFGSINYISYWCKYMGISVNVVSDQSIRMIDETGDIAGDDSDVYNQEIMDMVVRESKGKK